MTAALGLAACSRGGADLGDRPDIARGASLIAQSQCGACHQIPGINEAQGLVGPPLAGFSRRTTIAGVLANTPDNLAIFIASPQSVVRGGAMPDMGIAPDQARDIAAYLDSPR
jgi:cytochrome c2